jgi:hypothetical protein
MPSAPAPPASKNANFYSAQTEPLRAARILQLQQNKALHFFYSVQMNGHQSPLSNRESLAQALRTSRREEHHDQTFTLR